MTGITLPRLGRRLNLIVITAVVVLAVGGFAWAQSGGAYGIKWFSVDSGANTSFGGVYTLVGTIGQPEGAPATSSGGVFTLQGGVSQLPPPIIVPPSGIAASPGRNFYIIHDVTFRWTPVTYAIGYRVEYAKNKTFTIGLVTTDVSETDLSLTVSSVPNGTYYWRVRAKASLTTYGPPSTIETFVVSAP
jgi:hypothetical protein